MANVSSSNGLEKRPKLRFPGFDEPWNESKLSACFAKNIKKNTDGRISNVICNSAKMGLIPQRDYFDKDIANSDNTSGYYIIEHNDFVYNPRKSSDAPYGPISRYAYPDAGIVSPLYLCFRAKGDVDTNFFEWYFRSSAWHRYIYMTGDSGARHDRVSIKDDDFFSMPIRFPSSIEQKKIASFLNAIERRISSQQLLVDNLKKYKRGLLSNLFGEKITQGCTTKSYYFSEIAQRRSEKYDPSSGIEYPCVELENIEQETGKILATVPSTAQSSIKNIAMPGDTLFGKLRPYLRKYAFAKKTMACSSEIWALIPSDVVLPKFLFYLVQTEHFLRVANISSGTKMPRAEWSNIEKAEFFIPDFSVQRKVVSLLEGLDQKITFADSTLLSLNRLKASLLQHLFI